MALKIYMDVHIPKAITNGLRLRGIEVLTTQEDGTMELPDNELIERATHLRYVLFSFDVDMLIEGQRLQNENIEFSGIIYARPLKISIGECVKDLEIIATIAELEEMMNKIEFLPL
jgi:hypothetical protein